MKSEQAAVWECSHCSKAFKYESEKRRHEQSHVPQFECKVCSKKFSFLSALRRHEKQHERTGSVPCNKCRRKFRDETLLKRHILYAHKGTFTCTQCSTTFNSELALQTHMKTHKAESERRYHCRFDGCAKSFNFAHHLKHHELTHTDTKQFFCKECGKGFIQSHHLKVHLKTHNPETWLSCTEPNCDKKFINEYARKRHLATHRNRPASIKVQLKSVDEDGEVLGLTCDQLISEPKYSKHAPNGILKDEITDFSVRSLELSINEISETINKAVNVVLDKSFLDEVCNKFDDKVTVNENIISNCKDIIGDCISDENCLCTQINSNVGVMRKIIGTTTENLLKHKVDSTNANIIKLSKDLKTIVSENNVSIKTNPCEECHCDNWCSDNGKTLGIITHGAETPEIEYRLDGTVKVKDTYDIIFDSKVKIVDAPATIPTIVEDLSIRKYQENIQEQELKMIPFNSCKDVLGNCIVSGNGTIGEGCLCAKMAVDDQPMIAQEIEDITPCPKNTWLSQRL